MEENWIAPLRAGAFELAWDLFIDRYRRLILSAIRHYADDHDDLMDIFASACAALREDDLRRVRNFLSQPSQRAQVSTWLVVVVRHLAVDWYRHRDGRRRLPTFAQQLSPLQRQLFEYLVLEGRSHLESYELLRSASPDELQFSTFLRELRALHAALAARRPGAAMPILRPAPIAEEEADATDATAVAERSMLVEQALATLTPEARVVVELYVIEELPAAEVARMVGLPGAKAVYNISYRALATLREHLRSAGYSAGDL